MSAREIDSSKWTGVSDSDQQGDDWLPEAIVPRIKPRQAYIDLFRFASLPVFVLFLVFMTRGVPEEGRVLISLFDIPIVNTPQAVALTTCSWTYLFLHYYMKHIRKCVRFGTWVKFDRHGISCREKKRHVKWMDVSSVRVNSSWGRHLMNSTNIRVFLKPKNEKEAQSILSKSLSWRLDGTDVDFGLLWLATKRWHKLAHEQKEAESKPEA